MATITLSVQTAQGTFSVNRTTADNNVSRAQTAMQALIPGQTSTQLLQTALDRLLNQIIALTKNYERNQEAIADITLT